MRLCAALTHIIAEKQVTQMTREGQRLTEGNKLAGEREFVEVVKEEASEEKQYLPQIYHTVPVLPLSLYEHLHWY